MRMIEFSFQILYATIIQLNFLSHVSFVNFYNLKTHSKSYHVFVTCNRTFLSPYNLGCPQCLTIKLYVKIQKSKKVA